MAENQADSPVQAPQPPMLHSLRPHKLRRFSGDEGNAEDFIREAKLFLQLQPMADPVAAGWFLGALEGRARKEILAMEADEVNTTAKIFAILEQRWGEHRDSSTLAGAFFRRQQGLTESVGEYASTSAEFHCPWRRSDRIPLPHSGQLHDHHQSDRQREACLSSLCFPPRSTSAPWTTHGQ